MPPHSLPNAGTALILGIVALAAIPFIVAQVGRWKLHRNELPRAFSREQEENWIARPQPQDDWAGIDSARSKPGALAPGPRPYDWHTHVPAALLEPGRRPRGRC